MVNHIDRSEFVSFVTEHSRTAEEIAVATAKTAARLESIELLMKAFAERTEERCGIRGEVMKDLLKDVAELKSEKHKRLGAYAAFVAMWFAAMGLGGILVKVFL